MITTNLIHNYSLKNHRVSYTYVLATDNGIKTSSSRYAMNAIIAGILFTLFNLLPMLLLALYPVGIFRRMLSKCKLDRAGLMIFMEKFQSCYKDGLDGGRDMRSFASLYFVLRVIVVIAPKTIDDIFVCKVWFPRGILLMIATVLVALCRPYKKTYMTISDTLLLSYLSVVCYILSSNSYNAYFVPFMQVIFLLPFALVTLAVLLKLAKKL